MGGIYRFRDENLIIGVLSTADDVRDKLTIRLEAEFGPVDFVSEPVDFVWTGYYDREMGENIRRWFYSFDRLVDPSSLSEIKTLTNSIEEDYAVGNDRKVNLDPGLIDLNRLILATTKNVGHRVPLRDGIYAEVTLMYMKKDFHPLPWTYPDYQSPEYLRILKGIRELYRKKLKQQQ